MEDKFTLNWPGVLKSGAIVALILIVFSVIIYVFDLMTISVTAMSIVGFSVLIIVFLATWFAGNYYKKNFTRKEFSWGNAFVTLLLIGLFATVLSASYNAVFNNFIDPAYQTEMWEEMHYKMEEMYINLGMEEEQYAKSLEQFEKAKNMSPGELVTQELINGSIRTLVISLIVALIIRKKNPVFD